MASSFEHTLCCQTWTSFASTSRSTKACEYLNISFENVSNHIAFRGRSIPVRTILGPSALEISLLTKLFTPAPSLQLRVEHISQALHEYAPPRLPSPCLFYLMMFRASCVCKSVVSEYRGLLTISCFVILLEPSKGW